MSGLTDLRSRAGKAVATLAALTALALPGGAGAAPPVKLPDLTIASVVVTQSTAPFTYTVTVANVGNAPVDLVDISLHGWFSADDHLNPAPTPETGDSGACGLSAAPPGTRGRLRPRATTTVTISCSNVPQPDQDNLIVLVDDVGAVTESNEGNNQLVRPLS